MYAVSAQVNDLSVVHVPLDAENGFVLRPSAINGMLSEDASIKVAYFCSPGNPTGKLLSGSALAEVLSHPTWNGVVVLDEAYVDFSSPGSSLCQMVLEYPNLVVMQTLSKAFGLAGIRLGVAITSPPIARLLNSLKAPYNVSSPTSTLATAAFSPENLAVMKKYRAAILAQRDRLLQELPRIPGIGRFRGGLDANFLLFELLDSPAPSPNTFISNKNTNGDQAKHSPKPSNEVALAVYKTLAEKKGVVVRFRGKEYGCEGCLRATVGTEEEVTRFLQEIRGVLEDVYRAKGLVPSGSKEGKETMQNGDAVLVNGEQEAKEEEKANSVIA